MGMSVKPLVQSLAFIVGAEHVLTIVLHKVSIRQSVLEPLSKDAPPTGTWLAQLVKLILGHEFEPHTGGSIYYKTKQNPSAQKTRVLKDLGLSPTTY